MLVNIHEAKTNFSKLINLALSGEEIIVSRGNVPLIKLTPYNATESNTRKGGQLKGLLNISDDFDAPLPSNLLDKFYNSDI